MEYTLLILLLLIMIWINLRNKISKSQEKTEELSKEIAALRRRLEDSPKVADEVKEPEPEILKEPEVFVQPEPVRAIVEPARNLQSRKVRKPVNYEKYIGENLFGKIGILEQEAIKSSVHFAILRQCLKSIQRIFDLNKFVSFCFPLFFNFTGAAVVPHTEARCCSRNIVI